MGFLVAILVFVLSSGLVYGYGFDGWVVYAVAILFFAGLIFSAIAGHIGFSGGGNIDVRLYIALLVLLSAIFIPYFSS